MNLTRRICLLALLGVSTSLYISHAVLAAEGPITIDAHSGIRDFVMAEAAAERAGLPPGAPPGNTMLSIPSVLIYSPAGTLVYRGTANTIEKTTAILEAMPASVQKMPEAAASPKLADLLNMIPSFKTQQANILHDGHYVVYVITMQRDTPTTTQKSVMALRDRAGKLPIDTLVVYLQE